MTEQESSKGCFIAFALAVISKMLKEKSCKASAVYLKHVRVWQISSCQIITKNPHCYYVFKKNYDKLAIPLTYHWLRVVTKYYLLLSYSISQKVIKMQ